MCDLKVRQGPEGRGLDVSPARKGWGTGRMIPSAVGAALYRGLGIGLPSSFGIARLLSSLLFGVNAGDTTVFTGSVLTMGIVGFLACYIPSRRSLKVAPAVALRSE